MRCGKKLTKRPYDSGSTPTACRRARSTRKAICVKVKKEMPSGRTTSRCGVPGARLSRKKLAYLKQASAPRSPTMPTRIQAVRRRSVGAETMQRATAKLKAMEATRIARNRGSHQA